MANVKTQWPKKLIVELEDGSKLEFVCGAPKASKASGKTNVHAGGRVVLNGHMVMIGFNATQLD